MADAARLQRVQTRKEGTRGKWTMGICLVLVMCGVFVLRIVASENGMLKNYISIIVSDKAESIFTRRNGTKPLFDVEYCKTDGSLHQIAMELANFSSPPGSPSYNKMHHILYNTTGFRIINTDKLFVDVTNNLSKMLESFFREHQVIDSNNTSHPAGGGDGILTVRIVIFATAADCQLSPTIIVQSEQLWAVGMKYLSALQACHASPLCAIWDFSDYNYRWAQEKQIADSVMLLPVMTQTRLGPVDSSMIRPLANRSLDIVSFLSRTPRRLPILNQFAQRDWSMRLEQTLRVPYMKASYLDAKVCLVMHAYLPQSAGEYHRLSEIAQFGCIPVMETWADTVHVETYQRCGGVIFADYENLVNETEHVLWKLNQSKLEDDLERRTQWWKAGIQWPGVLKTIFLKQL